MQTYLMRVLLGAFVFFVCPAHAQMRMKPPQCGEHLEGTAQLPLSQIPLEFQFAYELDSARECVSTRNIQAACDHYKRALSMFDQTYPMYGNLRAATKMHLQQYGC